MSIVEWQIWRDKLRDILSRIKLCNGWQILLRDDTFINENGVSRFYIQIQFDAPDSLSGKNQRQYCRKWYLSSHMTKQEVVRTAYKAFQAAVLHEAAEQFLYRDCMIYSPHMDVDALCEISSRVDKRNNHL